MKKLILSILAISCLSGCAQDSRSASRPTKQPDGLALVLEAVECLQRKRGHVDGVFVQLHAVSSGMCVASFCDGMSGCRVQICELGLARKLEHDDETAQLADAGLYATKKILRAVAEVRQGIDLSKYRIEIKRPEDRWLVRFEVVRENRVPGDHFYAFLKDGSDDVSIVAGL